MVQNNYHQLYVEAFSCVDGFPSAYHAKKKKGEEQMMNY